MIPAGCRTSGSRPTEPSTRSCKDATGRHDERRPGPTGEHTCILLDVTSRGEGSKGGSLWREHSRRTGDGGELTRKLVMTDPPLPSRPIVCLRRVGYGWSLGWSADGTGCCCEYCSVAHRVGSGGRWAARAEGGGQPGDELGDTDPTGAIPHEVAMPSPVKPAAASIAGWINPDQSISLDREERTLQGGEHSESRGTGRDAERPLVDARLLTFRRRRPPSDGDGGPSFRGLLLLPFRGEHRPRPGPRVPALARRTDRRHPLWAIFCIPTTPSTIPPRLRHPPHPGPHALTHLNRPFLTPDMFSPSNPTVRLWSEQEGQEADPAEKTHEVRPLVCGLPRSPPADPPWHTPRLAGENRRGALTPDPGIDAHTLLAVVLTHLCV